MVTTRQRKSQNSTPRQWRRNEFESGGGGTDPAQSSGENLFWSCLPQLFGTKSTLSRFGERIRDGHYSLVSFVFAVFLLMVPPCPAICQSGWHVSPVPHGVGATALATPKLLTRSSPKLACVILSWISPGNGKWRANITFKNWLIYR